MSANQTNKWAPEGGLVKPRTGSPLPYPNHIFDPVGDEFASAGEPPSGRPRMVNSPPSSVGSVDPSDFSFSGSGSVSSRPDSPASDDGVKHSEASARRPSAASLFSVGQHLRRQSQRQLELDRLFYPADDSFASVRPKRRSARRRSSRSVAVSTHSAPVTPVTVTHGEEHKGAERVRRPSGYWDGPAVVTQTSLDALVKRHAFATVSKPSQGAMLEALFRDYGAIQLELEKITTARDKATIGHQILLKLCSHLPYASFEALKAAFAEAFVTERTQHQGIGDEPIRRKSELLTNQIEVEFRHTVLNAFDRMNQADFRLHLKTLEELYERGTEIEMSGDTEELLTTLYEVDGHVRVAPRHEDTLGQIFPDTMTEADVLNAHRTPVDPNCRRTLSISHPGESLLHVAVRHGRRSNASYVLSHGGNLFNRNDRGFAPNLGRLLPQKSEVVIAIKAFEAEFSEDEEALKMAKKSATYQRFIRLLNQAGPICMADFIEAFLHADKLDYNASLKPHIARVFSIQHLFDLDDSPSEDHQNMYTNEWVYRLLSTRLGILPEGNFEQVHGWLKPAYAYAMEHLDTSEGRELLNALFEVDAMELRELVQVNSGNAHALGVASETSSLSIVSLASSTSADVAVQEEQVLHRNPLHRRKSMDVSGDTWQRAVSFRLRNRFHEQTHHRDKNIVAPYAHVLKGKRSGQTKTIQAELVTAGRHQDQLQSESLLQAIRGNWRIECQRAMDAYRRGKPTCWTFWAKSNLKTMKKVIASSQTKMPFGEIVSILKGSSGGWSETSFKTRLLRVLKGDRHAEFANMNKSRLNDELTNLVLARLGISDRGTSVGRLAVKLCAEALSNYGRRCRSEKAVKLMNKLYHLPVSDLPIEETGQRNKALAQRLYDTFCAVQDFGELGSSQSSGQALFATSTLFSKTNQHHRVRDFAHSDLGMAQTVSVCA